mmetsp:Transcript_142644/g.251798  ORF Transcript_142644/g.251798 Transcript_142644/m.251798 type:complete len:1274 (-) Transcript_142644:326-4147(-)
MALSALTSLVLVFYLLYGFYQAGGDTTQNSALDTTITTTITTTIPQCSSPLGKQEYYLPILGTVDIDPEATVPGLIMTDLDLRSRYEPKVFAFWGADPLMKVPGGWPLCVRIYQKSISHYTNPKIAFANLQRWIVNSIDEDPKTHAIWVGYNRAPNIKTATALDAKQIATVGRAANLELEDKNVYTFFLRLSASLRGVMQPMWGFYTIWAWKAVIFLYHTEPEGLDNFGLLLEYAAKLGVPTAFFHTVPISAAIPFQNDMAFGQLTGVAMLAVRLVFFAGTKGFEHMAVANGLDLRTLMIYVMMRAGLWMPEFQVIQDWHAFYSVFALTNQSFLENHGKPNHGAFMGAQSNAISAPIQAIYFPVMFRLFGYVGHLNQVNLSLPQTQLRYGITFYEKPLFNKFMTSLAEMGGLEAWFWGDGMIWNVVNADYVNREVLSSACFWRNGGTAKSLNASMRVSCNLVSTKYGSRNTSMVWPYDYDKYGTWVENYLLFGPAWIRDAETNISSAVQTVVLWCDGAIWDDGCVIAGENMGFPMPVWSDGYERENPPTKYRNCTPGMSMKLHGDCQWCTAGKFTEKVGMTECLRCPTGYHSDGQSSSCTICGRGKFAQETGSEKCVTCSVGSFTAADGESKCELCAKGSWSKIAGATACIPCTGSLTTQFPGEIDESNCVCPRNTYKSNKLGAMKCEGCMEGLACEKNWPKNWATFGGEVVLEKNYFSWKSSQHSSFLCSNATGSCPGGPPEFCDGDRTGFLCTECKDSGYIKDGACETCPFFFRMFLALVFILATLGIFGMYYLANGLLTVNVDHPQGFFVFVGVLITILQIFGVVKNLQVPWPQGQHDFMDRSSVVFALDANSLPLSCIVNEKAVDQYIVQNCCAFVLMFLVMLLFYFMSLLSKIAKKVNLLWSSGKSMNVAGQISQALFIAFCTAMVRPMQCYDHPNGDQSVIMYPSVLCWDGGDHTGMMIVSAIVCLCYIIPFIAWCIYGCMTACAQSANSNHDFMCRYRFLLYRFRPDYWWWGVVFLFRQTTLAFATVVPASNPHAQVFFTAGVLTMYIYVVCLFWPWINSEITFLDSATCLLLVFFLLSATQFLPAAPETKGRVQYLLLSMLCVGIVCGRFFIIFVVSACKHGLFYEFGNDKPDRLHLCTQWIAFVHYLNQEQSHNIINVVHKMNMFDRKLLQDTVISWVANSEAIIPDIRVPAGTRLNKIASKFTCSEDMLATAENRTSNIQAPGKVLATDVGSSPFAEVVSHEHIKAHPRSFRILASSGTTGLV